MISERGRTWLVVGGSSGIGRAVVTLALERGAAVALTYFSHSERAESLVDTAKQQSRWAKAFPFDASQEGASKELLRDVASYAPTLDRIVICQAVNQVAHLADLPTEAWNHVLQVNLTQPFELIREGLPRLTASGASVTVISSINANRGRVGSVAYNVSKAGLNALVRTAALELGERGIRVNAVAPGFVQSEAQAKTPPLIKQQNQRQSALQRLASVEDIAECVVFLASDAARHVTGEVLTVDGGLWLADPIG